MAKAKKARIRIGDAGHEKDMARPAYRAAYENRRLIHEVAIAVRTMRESTGLTQQQLANAIDSSQPVIARLERGLDQRVPRFDLVRRIAEALGMRLRWVFAKPSKDATLVQIEGAAPLQK